MSAAFDGGPLEKRYLPGPKLYVRKCIPENPVAVVGLLHGYADHSARYRHVIERWAARGLATVAIDMRGHGRADGQRGACTRFDNFLDDAAELAFLVDDAAGTLPRFLFGHSFGGLVAVSSVLDAPRKWKGLVLSAPFLDLALAVPRAKVIAGKVASRVLPWLSLPGEIRGDACTRDAVRARDYDDDPLVFKTANARWFTETTAAQARVFQSLPKLSLPLRVLFGTDDRLVSLAAGKRLFDGAPSTDKTFDERRDFRHELHNDLGWEGVVDDTAEWILKRAS